MVNISVAEILKIHGKWIQATEYVRLIHQKLGISDKHAYNLIKKALKNNEIKRYLYPDRTVCYGLLEFGPLTEGKNDANTVIPVLAVRYSDMDPMVAASVAQQDVNLSLTDFCIQNKLVNDDPELKKLVDLYKMNRNQLAVIGLWWKVIAHLNGYDSFIDYMNARANIDRQLSALRGILESKKSSNGV